MVGGVSVLKHARSRPLPRTRWILGHSDAALLVAHTEIPWSTCTGRNLVRRGAGARGRRPTCPSLDLPYLRRVVVVPEFGATPMQAVRSGWDALSLGGGRPWPRPSSTQGALRFVTRDDAILLYTSGSTGTPKARPAYAPAADDPGLPHGRLHGDRPERRHPGPASDFLERRGWWTAIFGPVRGRRQNRPAGVLRLLPKRCASSERERVTSVRPDRPANEVRLLNEHDKVQTDLSSVEVGVISKRTARSHCDAGRSL